MKGKMKKCFFEKIIFLTIRIKKKRNRRTKNGGNKKR